MGVDFGAEIDALRGVDWEAERGAVADPAVQLPAYYTRVGVGWLGGWAGGRACVRACVRAGGRWQAPELPPPLVHAPQEFHAYPSGNLCWEAALEVTAAAKSVHAAVMDPEGKRLDPGGDAALRDTYSACMQQLLGALGVRPVADILDVGAATGLSSLALLRAFPHATVTGVDLSPYFLAVGRHQQRQREAGSGRTEALRLLHAAAEDTRLPDASFDLVSMCLVGAGPRAANSATLQSPSQPSLHAPPPTHPPDAQVCHELPRSATAAIYREAYRLLRPGGALAVMVSGGELVCCGGSAGLLRGVWLAQHCPPPPPPRPAVSRRWTPPPRLLSVCCPTLSPVSWAGGGSA